jgi:hypothetical protein
VTRGGDGMQSRMIFSAAVLVLLALAIPDVALAQYGYSSGHSDNPNGPTVSPYLNLLQNNNVLGPPTNYQSLVKPLIDQQSAIKRQGSSIQQLQQQIGSGGPTGNLSGGRATGHPTFYQNYSHYFTRNGGRPQQAAR